MAVRMPERGWRRSNMPGALSNDMASLTTDKGPTTPPDWQVLMSAYSPLVFYGAAVAAGWTLRRSSDRRAVVTR